jgi:HEAT repeat protein
MRPKIVIAVLLAGLAGLAGVFFLKHLAAPAQPAKFSTVRKDQPAAPAISPTADKATAANVAVSIAQVAADTNKLAQEHEAYVQSQIDKLQELQAHDDTQSLQTILSALTNSDKDIRAAAVESTIQFGSRDAIPVLNNLAARTEDPNEKKELLDAAEFLALPSLTEIRAQNPKVKLVSP